MDADTAKFTFGVTDSSPGSVPLGSIDHNPEHKVFGHVFTSLTFDGVTVNNPHIAVIPDLVGSQGSRQQHRTTGSYDPCMLMTGSAPQITIGMDVLQHLHLCRVR